jgi:hypothetical protein
MERERTQFDICPSTNELVRRGMVNVVVPGQLGCRTARIVSVGQASPSLDTLERKEEERQAREAEKQQRMLERRKQVVPYD